MTPIKCGGKFRTFSLGRFIIGPANVSRLEHRTKRAGTDDFFALWHHKIEDRFSVEREVVPCRSLGIVSLREEVLKSVAWDSERERWWGRCVNSYLDGLAVAYAQDFWEEPLAAQHVLIAAGVPYLDERVTRRLMPSQLVSIFRNIEGEGFVAPIGQDFGVLEIGSVDIQIPVSSITCANSSVLPPSRTRTFTTPCKTFALFVSKHQPDAWAA